MLTYEQLKLRSGRISATRASSVYNGRWRDVARSIQGWGEPFNGNAYTRRGQAQEHIVIKEFCAETGLDATSLLPVTTVVAQDNRFVHKGIHWACATPDALWYNDCGGLCMLECKTTNPEKYLNEWGQGQGDPWLDIPRYYRGQVLWQYATINLAAAYVAVLCGTAFQWFYIPRDFSAEERLIAKCKRLWLKYGYEKQPLRDTDRLDDDESGSEDEVTEVA